MNENEDAIFEDRVRYFAQLQKSARLNRIMHFFFLSFTRTFKKIFGT